MAASTTLTIRIPAAMKKRLDNLARTTARTKSWLAVRAIDDFVEVQTWQVDEIKKGLREADAGDFATPAEVEETFAKWAKNPLAARSPKRHRSGRRLRKQR
jgi:RHH-type transcriptional regulator, rel operon repressor / antitoxin RelB